MDGPIVIGIDCSTTAAKAVARDARGRDLGEGRSGVKLHDFGDGRYEQDPTDWWAAVCAALRALLALLPGAEVAAVSISNQRETFAPFDADGVPLRPAIVWLDERCRDEVDRFATRVGETRIHRLTGKPKDITPVVYRLAWMQRHEPDLYRRIALVLDVHGYLALRMTGTATTSWASADPLGVFDMQRKDYAPEILGPLGLAAAQFAPACPPGQVIGTVSAAAARETGLPEGTKLVAGGGDGQMAGLGANVLIPGRAYLNLGTAVVSGLHGMAYRTDPAFRTMGSATGDGYIYESCLRAGTFLVDWFVRHLLHLDPTGDGGVYAALEREAAALPAGAEGLLLLPYWMGVMPPHWDMQARGAIVGLAPQHGRAHLYRALLEGIAFDQAMVTGLTEAATGLRCTEYLAIGGGARSDLWCRIIADVSGRPVLRSTTVECSSMGAAMAAAVGAGWFPGFIEAAQAMSGPISRRFEPDPVASAHYARLMPAYRELYPRLKSLFAALAAATQMHGEPVLS